MLTSHRLIDQKWNDHESKILRLECLRESNFWKTTTALSPSGLVRRSLRTSKTVTENSKYLWLSSKRHSKNYKDMYPTFYLWDTTPHSVEKLPPEMQWPALQENITLKKWSRDEIPTTLKYTSNRDALFFTRTSPCNPIWKTIYDLFMNFNLFE